MSCKGFVGKTQGEEKIEMDEPTKFNPWTKQKAESIYEKAN